MSERSSVERKRLSLSRGELRVNVRELGQRAPTSREPEAMCRGSMLSVLERASPQPNSDTNGRASSQTQVLPKVYYLSILDVISDKCD